MADSVAYKVSFENVSQASAPAAEIRITDLLDPSLDVSTLRVHRIQFWDEIVEFPQGRASIQAVVDRQTESGVLVELTSHVDASTNEAVWTFMALDPETKQLPADPSLGFLPPNDDTHRGEGFIEFTINPKVGVATGTVVRNKASIVFDYNDPIVTNEVFNTIDAGAPQSKVEELPLIFNHGRFEVCCSGVDDEDGSGIASFQIQSSEQGGSYVPWTSRGAEGCSAFSTRGVGHTFDFYSVARDNVGNVEAAPTVPPSSLVVPDATTTVRFGDFNEDGLVNAADFKHEGQQGLYDCMTGPILSSRCGAKDVDWDGDVDLFDFADFQNRFVGIEEYQPMTTCLTAPLATPPTECKAKDFDLNAAVDLYDFAAFQLGFGGP